MIGDNWDLADEMCPNCVTPWKCNGPHLERPTDWAPDCRCGTCHTCLPAMRIPDNVFLGEN